ncbi:MAG: hypothetical protein M3406_11400 [Chloroflexota bacterium]|nr:hypothetical protein [Chloroflexota bacterium]
MTATAGVMLAVTPAFAGEITDENEAVEKIVIRVNDDPELDPELSVGGETIEIQSGDEVTFRIALNEDQTVAGRDNVVEVKDVFKTNRFEFVSAVGEFGATCTDPDASVPEDTSVTCMVNLDPADGNASLRIRLRALEFASEGEGCPVATNVVSTVEPSGGDQAQVRICAADEPTPSPTPSPTPAPVAPTPAPTAQALPDTATPSDLREAVATATLVVLALIGAATAKLAIITRRRVGSS